MGWGVWCVVGEGLDPVLPTQTHDGFLARLLGLMGRWICEKEGVGFWYVYLEGGATILDGFLMLCSCGVD